MLVLIRHGETEWSRDKRHTGRTDIPLTAAGREQAAPLGSGSPAGPSPRCSCARCGGRSRRPSWPGCGRRASRATTWSSGTTATTRAGRPPTSASRARAGSCGATACPGGETVEQVGERADRGDRAALAVDGDVAVFAHGHVLRILAARWIGLAPEHGGALALGTATLCELGFERERRVILTWNAR